MKNKSESNIDELILTYKSCKDPKKQRALHIKIVEAGMNIIKKIAVSVAMQSEAQLDDLMQVGALGLIKAINFYVPTKNAKFSTYAIYFIKGEIRHYVRDKLALIKTPRQVQELIFKVYAAAKDLKVHGNNEPSIAQISEYINIPEKRVEEVMKIDKYKFMVSLDQTLSSDEEDSSLLEKIPAEDYMATGSTYDDKILVENAIKKLPEELRTILQLSFFEELNQREISEKMHLSPMQVSRRIKKALNRMYTLMEQEKE